MFRMLKPDYCPASAPPWSRWRAFLLALSLSLGSCTFWLPSAHADDEAAALDYQVKAAMLYKFLGYIEWPAESFRAQTSPYVIAILGADSVADELKQITRNRTVNNRPIRVMEISSLKALNHDIHMLFVGEGQSHRLTKVLKVASRYPIVTVTESEQGLEEGSIINLRLVDGRVRFDVSLPDTARRDLRLSARMLSVASSVRKGTE